MSTDQTAPGADLKSTVFLPRTDFPMRAGLPKREPDWLARWERIGIYDALRAKTGRTPFVLHDGPPYANGHLHIGHGLNKILKDMVVRAQQMMGRDAPYVPGWDCHGLPIEWKIEEEYRKKGRDKDAVPILELRAECRKFAARWVDIQRDEFKRLGVMGNWADPYLTMDYHAEAVIADEFMKFVMNGTLYQGSKPVMWSPIEKTALAEAEVEYQDKDSFTIWVKFKVLGSGPLAGAKVVIWTTTPWTIPSNRGVVFGEEIAYGLYEVTATPEECWASVGEQFLLADNMAADVFARARLTPEMVRRVRDVPVSEFDGVALAHPLAGIAEGAGEWDTPRDFRAAPFVMDSEGTGFVHCAPSHGMEEFELYRDLGMLEQVITYNVTEDGSFRADLPLFGGKRILKPNGKEGNANKAVIDTLAAAGGLLARGKITHSYPHSWRSKAPVIFRNTPQWFVAIDKELPEGGTIRGRALEAIAATRFTPETGRNRLRAMVENRPDWVLSRQRAWGVPLTCFIKKGALPTDPDFLLRDAEVNAAVTAAFEAEGADAWYADGACERFLGARAKDYEQVFDVLDVWFDSGSTHAFVLRDRADGQRPADLYLEGTDQHRGWFQSSLLQACGTMGQAPYKGVLTHGFTLDQNGMKMSKSLGNTTVPAEVVQQYGADILRLWVAQADYTADQRIGPEILKNTADAYRRLRNTLRFCLGALEGFTEAERLPEAQMPELESWVLHRLAELDGQVRAGYDALDFTRVFSALFQFATVDLSAFYFDIRKDALYCDGADSLRRRAARTVIDLCFERLVVWLAPILVFTMEDAWLHRHGDAEGTGAGSVHLLDFPDTPAAWANGELAARWAQIRTARRVITGALEVARTAKDIGASLEAAPVVYVADDGLRAVLAQMPLADLAITSDITLSDAPGPEGAFALEDVPGIAVVVARASGDKCGRCWRILPEVASDPRGVCTRCGAVLDTVPAE